MNKLFVGAAILTAIGIGGMDAELVLANETDPLPNTEETEVYEEENGQDAKQNVETPLENEAPTNETELGVGELENNVFEEEEREPDQSMVLPDEPEPEMKEEAENNKNVEDVIVEEKDVANEAQAFAERVSQKTLSGVDISHWQNGIKVENLDADFVFCKATGGTQYKDTNFNSYAQSVLQSGKLLGFYHFAQEKGCPGTAEEEAGHFYNTVQNYIGKGIPVLDWEADALRQGPSWAKTFMDTFYNLSGVKCLIYMSAYTTRVYDWSEVADSGYKLWLAQYADNNPVYGHDKEPWRDDKGVGAFQEPVVHQYTSTGRLPGYTGNLDLDIFYGDANTWKDLARVENVPTQYEMYRVYNPNSGEHFYTKDINERNDLVRLGWHNEGIGWLAPRTGASVYRLYNPNAGDHHYTLYVSERDTLIRAGWRYEGIGWCSDPMNAVPLYRSYNPNAVSGAHHYTTDKNEHDFLIRLGWRDEGLAWYGVSPSQNKRSAQTGIHVLSFTMDETEQHCKPSTESLVMKNTNFKNNVSVSVKNTSELPAEKNQWVFDQTDYLTKL